jgi:type IV secretion system protein VirB2
MLIPHLKHSAQYIQGKFNLNSSEFTAAAAFLLLAIVILMPDNSYAYTQGTGSAAVGNVICAIVNELQGPVARGVAAFGIIFLGFSLFLGKISWGVALALGIGIGCIFGAGTIVDMLSGKTGGTCQGGVAQTT